MALFSPGALCRSTPGRPNCLACAKLDAVTEMILRRAVATTLLASTLVLLHPASGLEVPGDIALLAKEAKVILAGTVDSIGCEWNKGRTTIVTRIALRDVIVIKGSVDTNRTVLTLGGGRVGDEEIIREGEPHLRQGERYILLCSAADLGSELNSYLPIAGLNQGIFPVRPSRRTGRPVVIGNGDREVVGIEDGKLLVVDSDSSRAKPTLQGTAIDLPFIPGRWKRPSKRDSLARISAVAHPHRKSALAAIPKSGGDRRPSRPAPAPVWVPGSQRAVQSGEPTVRILDAASDRGTRMSESQFLDEMRRLSAP